MCPATVVVQTDWNPEAEHGGLYKLLGPNPSVDTDKKIVTGELTASGGVDTGVKIEIRVGGPAIGFQQVTAQMYTDDSILLGYVSTDEQVQHSADKPTVSLIAPLKKNPQIIMWDPATYPDAKTIADLPKDTTLLVFDGGVFPDYLVGKGIVQQSQIEGGYDGTPARFVAADGKLAQQGFASAEPYIYEHEVPEWGKPVAFQLIHDTGLEIYSQTIGTKPENITKFADCFKKLIPIMQQADVDYAKDPAATNTLIVEPREAVRHRLGVQRGRRRLLGRAAGEARARRQRGRLLRWHGRGPRAGRHRQPAPDLRQAERHGEGRREPRGHHGSAVRGQEHPVLITI